MTSNEKGRPRREGGPRDEQPDGRNVVIRVRHPAALVEPFPVDVMALCRAMFDHGVDVGRMQAEQDEHHAWQAALEPARTMNRAAGHRTRAELDARRYPGYTPERLAELRAAARRRYGLPLGETYEDR